VAALAVPGVDGSSGAGPPGGYREDDARQVLREVRGRGLQLHEVLQHGSRCGGSRRTGGDLAAFRQVQMSTKAPPGPGDTWLGETLVHSEDIRRPLGIAHSYPLAWVTRATEFYAKSNALIGGKKRVAGLTLKATDTDWSYGSGPIVEGPASSLLLAAAGRMVAFDELAGPGLPTLRTR
jgi:uncharacterized protein (TIGR03083 family)